MDYQVSTEEGLESLREKPGIWRYITKRIDTIFVSQD